MSEQTIDLILLAEFVGGLLFLSGLFAYQGWRNRSWDAVTLGLVASFFILAAIFSESWAAERWGWLRRQGDLQWWNRIAFAIPWNLLLLALAWNAGFPAALWRAATSVIRRAGRMLALAWGAWKRSLRRAVSAWRGRKRGPE